MNPNIDNTNNLIFQLMERKSIEDEKGEIDPKRGAPSGKLAKANRGRDDGSQKLTMGGFHKKIKTDLKSVINDSNASYRIMRDYE